MSNGFFHVSVQIARDWTGFWGFDGYFRCLCDIFEGMGGEGQYMHFWGYGWGEEMMTAYGDLEKSAVIGNFAKRAVEGAEPFSRQEGVSGGAPVAQGHLKFKCLAYLELPFL